ncbi:MAG: hypothetical protein M9885_15085 [Burkholderiaceae bacterium]|nr:hypothetical protein [Burkholderiaceae bacterium]
MISPREKRSSSDLAYQSGEVRMRKLTCAVISVSMAVTGCATSSADIATAYVSPLQYQGYDCEQIITETRRLEQRVHELGGRLDEAASNDKAIMGVGLVLFWPVLFALGGTKQQEAEYARIRGEYEALQQVAVQKKCSRQMVASANAASAVSQSGGQEKGELAIDPSIPRIPGNDLSIGARTVSLGDGDWIELSKSDGNVLASTLPSSGAAALYAGNSQEVKVATTVAAEARGGALGRIVVVSANPQAHSGLQTWNVEPCKVADARIEKLGNNFDLPECLYVRRVNALAPQVASDLTVALAWAQSQRLSTAPIYFEVGYAKYGHNGFLATKAFLPNSEAADEGAAMSWGRSLARSMRPLAQGTLARAYLPPSLNAPMPPSAPKALADPAIPASTAVVVPPSAEEPATRKGGSVEASEAFRERERSALEATGIRVIGGPR